MTLFGVPKERHSVIRALIHLFNKNNSMLQVATDDVESYLKENLGRVQVAPGAI